MLTEPPALVVAAGVVGAGVVGAHSPDVLVGQVNPVSLAELAAPVEAALVAPLDEPPEVGVPPEALDFELDEQAVNATAATTPTVTMPAQPARFERTTTIRLSPPKSYVSM